MNLFNAALKVEFLKLYKSKVIWLTAITFTIAPLMAGFFMIVLQHPEFAKSAGLLGAKAQIAGEASWPSYLDLYAQIIAVGGLLVFGFITSWIFGREFIEGTAKDLLALPFPRSVIMTAKFTVSFMTNIVLTLYIVSLGVIIGLFIRLPEGSIPILIDGLVTLLIITLLTIILTTPIAFFACYSRGYLAPLGFVFLILVLSQIITAAGFGTYFPWAIPALLSGIVEGEDTLTIGRLIFIIITSFIGVIGTLSWWRYADHH